MSWLAPKFILATALLTLAGCDLYFGDDPPPVCAYGQGDDRGASIYYAEYRDPTTATCVPSYGGGGGCDDPCGPCPEFVGDVAQPDMGLCESQCTGLDEWSCHAASGCYAAYLDNPADDGGRQYWGCWQTPPSGPVQGACDKLTAQECSRHDNCSLDYLGGEGSAKFDACVTEPAVDVYCLDDSACGDGRRCDYTTCYPDPSCENCPTCGVCADICFGLCVPENPGTCANIDCGPGYTCEDQCYGGAGAPGTMTTCSPVCVPDVTCTAVDCGPGTTCGQVCTMTSNGVTKCETACVPDHDPGSCYGDVNCFANAPSCPTGTTAGVRDGCWTGYCIPTADCGPNDPGSCTGNIACDALPPQCPSGTVPGITDACWSGYCIPTNQCPAASCEMLTTESTCQARGDCAAVYTGANCTCYPGYCECTTLTFDRCQNAMW